MVDVDKTREKALNIALNKITGAWDDDLLAALLGELKAEDFDLSFTGFEPVDLEKLLGTKDEAKEDGFDVESELKQPAFSKLGDIWHLGKHTVICGDSTDGDVQASPGRCEGQPCLYRSPVHGQPGEQLREDHQR